MPSYIRQQCATPLHTFLLCLNKEPYRYRKSNLNQNYNLHHELYETQLSGFSETAEDIQFEQFLLYHTADDQTLPTALGLHFKPTYVFLHHAVML
jgi:hypothetical protein